MLARNGVRRDSASKRSRSSAAPARPAIAMRWMMALVEPPSAMAAVTAFSNASVREDVARAAGPPRPSRRCGGRRPWPCADVRSRRPGSTMRRAASARAPRPPPPSSRPCPSSCRCRRSARCRPPSRARRTRRACRRAARPSTSRRRCRSRAPGRASCRAASARRARRSRAGSCWWRPSRRAGHRLVAAAHQHRRRRRDTTRSASSASIARRLR